MHTRGHEHDTIAGLEIIMSIYKNELMGDFFMAFSMDGGPGPG